MSTIGDSERLDEGAQVIIACAFLYRLNDGYVEVFLPYRAATKKFLPNVFELPGGHIDFGEDIKAGLAREIREELHMEITIGDEFAAFTYTNQIKKSHSIEVVYFAQFVGDTTRIQLNPEDHSHYVWVTEEELPQLYATQKASEDHEALVIQKGFDILLGRKTLR